MVAEEEKTPEQLRDEANSLIAKGRRIQRENQERENLLNKRELVLDDRDILLNTKEISYEENQKSI